MRHDADAGATAVAAVRRLPSAALAGLREAFAGELADRLPRLRAAAASDGTTLLADAVRDAHALGSSAAVLGEPDASRAARAAESALLDALAGDADAVTRFRACVAELDDRLAGWTP